MNRRYDHEDEILARARLESTAFVRGDQCWSCGYPEPMLVTRGGICTTCLGCGAQRIGERKIPWNAPHAAERIMAACRIALTHGCHDARVVDIVRTYGAKVDTQRVDEFVRREAP